MAVRTKVEPIHRDIRLLLNDLSAESQSAAIASFAREQLADAQDINKRALGSLPTHETFVNGQRSSNIDAVKPSGSVVYEFDLFSSVFGFIDLLLIRNSPVGTPPKDRHPGLYRRSHILLADGVEVDQRAALPDAREFVYLNTQPYARKIEKGLSQQAPDGVYQVVAHLAARRFGNIAKITFGYRRLAGGVRGGKEDRQPAIIITVG
jgi:hypothetical protein